MSGYILWGWTSRWHIKPSPIPVMAGTLRECWSREKQFRKDYSDALTGVYKQGDSPEGLALQVKERVSE